MYTYTYTQNKHCSYKKKTKCDNHMYTNESLPICITFSMKLSSRIKLGHMYYAVTSFTCFSVYGTNLRKIKILS